MTLPSLSRAASLVLWTLACAGTPKAQCLDWRTFPLTGVPPQCSSSLALQVHDDGSGPALYIGLADLVPPYGELPGIQRWNGSSFEPVGQGLVGDVRALTTFDDGSGLALYAGGWFTLPGTGASSVARWDGSAWSALSNSPNGTVHALAFHDEGSGPALFAGGEFTAADGNPTRFVARWQGGAWSPLAVPIVGGSFVLALASFDDGSGSALYVGGAYPVPGGSGVENIARWRQNAWTPLNAGTNGRVNSLEAWDDGSGPALYVGGLFNAPERGIARWSGAGWSRVGAGVPSWISSLRVVDFGQGPRLVGGSYASQTDTIGVRAWDGAAWSFLPAPGAVTCTPFRVVTALASFDGGSGPQLFAGTTVGAMGAVSRSFSRWNGTVWETVGTPPAGLQGEALRALVTFDDGTGPALYTGGDFCGADAHTAQSVARWDGQRWAAVGVNAADFATYALGTFDAGGGPRLFQGGQEARLLELVNGSWVERGASHVGGRSIFALRSFAGNMYVGGTFTVMNAVASPNLVRWNGTSFVAIGSGPTAGVNGAVNALVTFDDGTGESLYVGGTFTMGNTVAMNRVGRWNGTSFAPLGTGMNGLVDALVVHDDGTGPALYAAGVFTLAGGFPALNVARWHPGSSTWSPLGPGLNAQVLSLGTFDDGSGPALYAGGNFTASGSTPIQRIAKWNGVAWSAVGAGTDAGVWALQSFDDGTGIGPGLFVGGEFHHAGALPSELFAAWRGCDGPISRFCFGDGSVGACPCGNQGLVARGCDNSFGTGGARLIATGTTAADTLAIHSSGELPNAATLVFQGTTLLTGPVPFGDGLRCTGGATLRLYTANASNGAVSVPAPGQPPIRARLAALGDPLAPGSVRAYQAWYRDSNPSFCAAPAGNAWNLSNAVRIVW